MKFTKLYRLVFMNAILTTTDNLKWSSIDLISYLWSDAKGKKKIQVPNRKESM